MVLDILLGGVYALERIARDSARDHPAVVEVLAAFLREHTHDEAAHAAAHDGAPDSEVGRIRPDLQAALTVLGRRTTAHDSDDRIDLGGADLTDAKLDGAYLGGADLTGADLNGARGLPVPIPPSTGG
jgi:hypothetical protein